MIVKTSPEWPGIRAWLEEQIEAKQLALENPDCRIVQTDVLRGEIKAYRDQIEFVDPKPKPEMADTPFVKGAGY